MLSSYLSLPLATGGSIALAILGIGFLIFVHELGHYLACRLTRTRVETFSIGFGTRLFGWENLPGQPKRFTLGRRRLDPADHAMDFRVALVPLGGYVKMAGENPGEEKSGAPDEFPSKPLSSRVFIVSAGVVMNVIAAFVFYVIAYGAHIEEEPAMLGAVRTGGPAWEAGLRPGDRILSFDGSRTRSFFELKRETVVRAADRPVQVSVQRGEESFDVEVTPRYDEEIGAVLMSIQAPQYLVIEKEGRKLQIGPEDEVDVEGVKVRGPVDALRMIRAALTADPGAAQVVVTSAGGQAWTLEWTDAKPEAPASQSYKVAIEQTGLATVKAVRGDAAEVLQVGDVVVAAGSGLERRPVTSNLTWEAVPFLPGVTHLVVRREGAELEAPLPTGNPGKLHDWMLDVHLDIPTGLAVRPLPAGTVVPLSPSGAFRYPSSPAADAGIVAGEELVRIGDTEVSTWEQVIGIIRRVKEAQPLEMVVRGKDGDERKVSVTPVAVVPLEGPELAEAPFWEPYETEGLLDAVSVAFARTGREIKGVFSLIGAFFTGRLNFEKNIGGPVTIVRASSDAVQRNWLHFLTFLAYISVTLAVLNILPIPILDGGHLLFMLIEKVKGSPLKDETIGKLQFAGLLLLLLLMVFAFKNDFTLLFE